VIDTSAAIPTQVTTPAARSVAGAIDRPPGLRDTRDSTAMLDAWDRDA
jgi:hypothetical protein